MLYLALAVTGCTDTVCFWFDYRFCLAENAKQKRCTPQKNFVVWCAVSPLARFGVGAVPLPF